jgi:L-aminopeptidase/D-esterase-like protein
MSGAVGNGLGTTAKYLRGAGGNGLGTASRVAAWAPQHHAK